MKKNLTARTVIIVVTILLCVYGIIGIPTSKASLVQNFKDNIRLGLDLKGGSHLVLQVQVQDAVKADANQTMERLKLDLKKQNVSWNSMEVTEPKDISEADTVQLLIKGVPATESSAFRSAVSERYPTYILSVTNSTDYSLKLKPSDLNDLKVDTVKRAIDTIGNRINQLGLAESAVLFRHVLKNAMIPILTGVVVVIPLLFMGSLLSESFFGIPGLGSYTIDAIQAQDFAVVRSMVFIGSVLYILGLLLTDLSYTVVDPRIRLE